MRILVDGIVFQNSYQRGIQRYCREVLGRIGREHEVVIFLREPAQSELPSNCRVVRWPGCYQVGHWNLPLRAWRKIQRRVLAPDLRGYDIFHSSYYSVSPVADAASVVTVHDMIMVTHAETFSTPQDRRQVQLQQSAILESKAIIVVSETTRDKVLAHYPGVAGKVRVVHSAADHAVSAEVSRLPRGVVRPYVLFVGDRRYYKNFAVLVKALRSESWPVEVGVVVVGPPWLAEEEVELATEIRCGRIRFLGRVDDVTLASLYRQAVAFVFPSRDEGFGLPLLEAQSNGCPVICSDIAVFHEVVGDSACYFTASAAAELALAVGRMFREVDLRAAYVRRGLVNVGRFSWDRCAEQTVAVYRQVRESIR